MIRSRHVDSALAAFRLVRFSAIGLSVVAALLLSGLINTWFLIGPSRWRSLLATAYGVVLLIKLGLFGMMLVLAALNRYRAAPALGAALDTRRSAQPALRALRTDRLG